MRGARIIIIFFTEFACPTRALYGSVKYVLYFMWSTRSETSLLHLEFQYVSFLSLQNLQPSNTRADTNMDMNVGPKGANLDTEEDVDIDTCRGGGRSLAALHHVMLHSQ